MKTLAPKLSTEKSRDFFADKSVQAAAAAVLLAAFLSSNSFASDPFTAKTLHAAAIRTLRVETDSGAISLKAGDESTLAFDVSPAAAPGDDCRVSQTFAGSTLTLAAKSASRSFLSGGKPCTAGFAVTAPARVAVEAVSGSGDVDLGAFAGPAAVKTGSGSIAVRGATGPLVLRAGSGRISGEAAGPADLTAGSGAISLTGLTGTAKARSGSGAVFLQWKTAPKSGELDLRSGSGDVTAVLPAGTRARTSLVSGSGTTASALADDDSALLKATLRSGSGAATIKTAK